MTLLRLTLLTLGLLRCPTASEMQPWDQMFFSHWDRVEEPMDSVDDEPADVADSSADMQPGGVIEYGEVDAIENVVILGAGPAGLSAAIYAARANLRPLLIAKDSGQLASTGAVENYPSCDVSSSGAGIIASFWQQAKTFGARSLIAEITNVNLSASPFEAQMSDGHTVSFQSMIVASGANSKRMNIPGEEKYYGNGVASCATCDGWHYRGQDVLVIGGGDTAMETALFLSRICRSVRLVHRRDRFRASKIMSDRVLAHKKITVEWNTTAVEFVGDDHKLTHVALSNSWTEQERLQEVQAAFVVIGHTPNTHMFKDGLLRVDQEGYIQTHSGTQTNLPGIFAAGDVADRIYRQAITSAGTGAMAAMDVERFLDGLSATSDSVEPSVAATSCSPCTPQRSPTHSY